MYLTKNIEPYSAKKNMNVKINLKITLHVGLWNDANSNCKYTRYIGHRVTRFEMPRFCCLMSLARKSSEKIITVVMD